MLAFIDESELWLIYLWNFISKITQIPYQKLKTKVGEQCETSDMSILIYNMESFRGGGTAQLV